MKDYLNKKRTVFKYANMLLCRVFTEIAKRQTTVFMKSFKIKSATVEFKYKELFVVISIGIDSKLAGAVQGAYGGTDRVQQRCA